MALFGKADEHLPLLTKLYQLEFDPYTGAGDLELFLIHFLEGQRYGDSPAVIPPLPDDTNEREGILRSVGNFVMLVCSIMRSVADRKPPEVEQEIEINSLFSEYIRPSAQFVFDGVDEHGNQKGFWAVFHFHMYWERHISDPSEWGHLLKLNVLPALLEAIRRQALARCTECGAVFERTRTGQIYCSHRCANRKSSRNKKREKKEKTLLKSYF